MPDALKRHAKMKLLSTPATFRSEFERLMKSYRHFDWAVAWASTGFDAFCLLDAYRSKARHIVIGTEFQQTHPDYIEEFAIDPGFRFRMDRDAFSGFFHPKVYLFSNDEDHWEAVIGSANFTKAAFSGNVEHAILVGNADNCSGLGYRDLFREIQRLWNATTPVTESQLRDYRRQWNHNRTRLMAAKGLDSRGLRSGTLCDNKVLTLPWKKYFGEIRQANPDWFPRRLKTLRAVREILQQTPSLHDMTHKDRARVCGTAPDREIQWRFFGSMAGAIDFKRRIKDNDTRISDALD